MEDKGVAEGKSDAQREARLEAIVRECIRRRVDGEGPSDQQLLTEHSDLLPELGEELRKLALIEAAERRVGSSAGASTDWRAARLPPGDSFPGYEIIGEIHRGGQGVVYRAVQKSTQRTVAIKVMHEGPFAGSADRVRFEREIQILGRFNHPSIVTIHDSGQAAGSAFFVMDYIEGAPLDAYMTQGKKSVTETLQLFTKICDAVSAAHLRGVIHRDLKPGNIRVDAEGVPHVLDFGLAKVAPYDVIAGEKPEAITMTGQFVGSLPWASPEQAAGSQDQIDIRTDVYSLGVILYRMLTGAFPYMVSGMMRDVVDNILTAAPTRPRGLRPEIDDEVETIVLKCLAKETERRYQSAGELARDIRRYLAGEPIEALRDSVGYLVRKHLRKYRLPVTIAILFVALVTGGFVTSLLFWGEAARERSEAERQAAIAQAVADFLNEDLLAAADPRNTANRSITVKEVLDAAADSIEGRFKNEPLVEASVRETLGRTYLNLGEYDLAEAQLVPVLALRRAELDHDHPRILSSMNDLAELYRHQGRYEEAEPLLTNALAACRRVLGDGHPDTLGRMNDLALLYRDLGRYPDARRLVTEALSGFRRTLGPENENTLAAMTNLAKVYRNLGQFADSEALYLEVVATKRRVLGEDHPLTLAALTSLAVLYSDQGRSSDAEELLVEVVERYRRTLGEQHSYTLRAMHQLANTYRDQRRHDEAELLLGEALTLQRAVLGEDHVDTLTTLSTLGLLYLEMGRHAEAEPLIVEALESKRRVRGADHPSTLMSMHHLGILRRAQGRHAETETLFAELLPARRRLLGESHPHTLVAMGFLAAARAKLGRYAEAEPVARELVTRLKDQSPPAPPTRVARALHLLADILMNRGDLQAAEPLLRESLERRQAALPESDPSIAVTEGALGECLTALGRYEEAEALLLESYSRLAPQEGEENDEARQACERIAALYEAWGEPERAAEWRARSGDTEHGDP
ncbi:MAG: serine/threonine protein kinase [bacterium]|nr:serine/threonine protein kinase [bacterium]